jgi:hypothetical protein
MAAQAVRPWQMESTASGGWRATGTVAYNRSLLRAAFELRSNGMVSLTGQEQLTAALPLGAERFDASGLRVTTTPETRR